MIIKKIKIENYISRKYVGLMNMKRFYNSKLENTKIPFYLNPRYNAHWHCDSLPYVYQTN